MSASESDVRPRVRLGVLQQRAGKWSDANATLQAVRERRSELAGSPVEPVFLLALSQGLVRLDQPEEGLRYAREAAALRVSSPDPLLLTSEILFQLSRHAEAAQVLENALDRFGDHPDVLTALAVVQQRMEQFDEASRLCGLALERRPDHPRATGVLGEVHLQQGDYAGALPLLERAIELTPQSLSWRRAAVEAAIGARDIPRAKRILDDSLKEHPDEAFFHYRLADILASQQESERAVAVAKHATEISPHDGRTWTSLAFALNAAGRIDDARVAIEEALRHRPIHEMTVKLAQSIGVLEQ